MVSSSTKILTPPNGDQYSASVAPLYQTTTFKQSSLDHLQEYDYTRSGNPTRTALQNHLSQIIGCHSTFAVTSGMTCLDVILRLLKVGDEVIAGDDLYGGTNRLLTFLAKKGMITVKHVDTSCLETMKRAVSSKTKMLILESPTNPLMKVCAAPEITKYVKSNFPETLVVFDNTMMSPLRCKPLEFGVDIVYESATKYLNGHHDIMAGIVYTDSPQLAQDMYFVINSTGCGLAPYDCWLLARGLKTLSIRLRQQEENAMEIAHWLEGLGVRVRYPGLKSHPQHKLHKSFNSGFGGVLALHTDDISASKIVVEATKLWGVTVSFGCVNSLISMPCLMSHASIDEKTRKERKFPEDIVRLCVGIEDVKDLKQDLLQALHKAKVVTQLRARL